MSDYELIDILCTITSKLADVVREQNAIIKQHEINTPQLDAEVETIWGVLDRAENTLRRR